VSADLIQADVLAWLRGNAWLVQNGFMPRAHGVLADPPYFLGSIVKRFGKPDSKPAQYGKDGSFGRLSKGFMSQTWDGFEDQWHYQAWVTEWASMLLDFVHPGALGIFFGGTRTYHRLAAGLEDAGWIVRDCIGAAWIYGSGFPKNHNVGKDFQAKRRGWRGPAISNDAMLSMTPRERLEHLRNERATEGHGSALKPAFEPAVIVQAPFDGSIADTFARWGTGLLNIDGTRIEANDDQLAEKYWSTRNAPPRENAIYGVDNRPRSDGRLEPHPAGRWPSNLILDEHAAAALDAMSGTSGPDHRGRGNGHRPGGFGDVGAEKGSGEPNSVLYADSGGPSRYFYTAKASAFEREAGLDSFAPAPVRDTNWSGDGMRLRQDGTERKQPFKRCTHPTMKNITLTEYLARLILAPASIGERRLLVPFAGVASEMIGARLAGWEHVTGIEREAEYVEQGRARLAWWAQFTSYEQAKRAYEGVRVDETREQAGQLPLFAETAS